MCDFFRFIGADIGLNHIFTCVDIAYRVPIRHVGTTFTFACRCQITAIHLGGQAREPHRA